MVEFNTRQIFSFLSNTFGSPNPLVAHYQRVRTRKRWSFEEMEASNNTEAEDRVVNRTVKRRDRLGNRGWWVKEKGVAR
ncbi:hypothetical protein WN55_09327 [Dufourea novaeangliae]|uniref:Uncharacterized protein n=1 Tax=Dufourea novaeangliae TaxID=178035 RepID=A0A154P9B6_DUFNO|nr:hypothetical protein WN55_09327 [Dufourea novaeangliae]